MRSFTFAVAIVTTLAATTLHAATADLPIGYLPADRLQTALRQTLSPQGRYVLLTPAGPARVIDTEAKIEDARRVIEELQQAPALVALNLSFTVVSQKTVQRRVVSSPQAGDAFPYPTRFAPPRILQNPNGGYTVVPTQPTAFTTRSTGVASTTSVVAETVPTREVIRRLVASSVPGRSAPLPLVAQVADPAALRALAIKLGAATESEPAWAAAGTELLLRTELTGGQLVVNVTPQIVLPGLPAPRHIPLPMCAAGIPLQRGAAAPIGTLPRTDAEFFHLFLGTTLVSAEATTALSIGAEVSYLGSPPPARK